MRFIDFEYADINHSAYDIGIYFCEFAGNICGHTLLDVITFVYVLGAVICMKFIVEYPGC